MKNSNFTIILALSIFQLFSIRTQGQEVNSIQSFTTEADQFLRTHVSDGMVAYQAVKGDKRLSALIDFIAEFDYTVLSSSEQKAYLINAYNLLVIDGVRQGYPVQSVLKLNQFFNQRNYMVNGKDLSLNDLEKNDILKQFNDPRLHFVLVCAAKSCPLLASHAYNGEMLEMQIEEKTKNFINNPEFVSAPEGTGKITLSKIFEWYYDDFGGSKNGLISFVNTYRTRPISENSSVQYMIYDWSLNDAAPPILGNNANRYINSSTIGKGGVEIKLFNNLYSQNLPDFTAEGDRRENYFTSSLSAIYGISSRFNLGFDLRYRRVSIHNGTGSPFSVFNFDDAELSRALVTYIGPKIRYAPIPKWNNFSIQSALWIPINNNLTGTDQLPWVDWDAPTWWTQLFNDFTIGTDFSLFTEFDLLWEDIGSESKGKTNQFSTPITAIFSYYPVINTTLYGLANFAPKYRPNWDYYYQLGLGAKYQFSPNFELEFLYTYFGNDYLHDLSGKAATINVGVRYSR